MTSRAIRIERSTPPDIATATRRICAGLRRPTDGRRQLHPLRGERC